MPRKGVNRRFYSAPPSANRRTLATHSRLAKTEQKRNLTRLFVFGALSLGLLILILSGGLSALANLAFFVGQPGKTEVTPTPAPVFLASPILVPLPSATNSAEIKLAGFSQKETTIEIFLNEELLGEIKTNQDGQFEKSLTLEEGENEIYAVAQDFLGNYSNPSEKTKIVLDQESPELIIEAPEEGKTFYQQQNQSIEIKGQTETEALLYFNDHLLVLNPEGKFSSQFKLIQGENILRFLVKDAAGNQTEKELIVFYQP